MSLDHMRTMLTTIQEYPNCEISLTFNNDSQQPVLYVSYRKDLFEVTHAQTHAVDTFYTIESAIKAIDKELNGELQKTSK
jgi:hypothetical protein